MRCSLWVLAIRHLRENVAFAVNGCVTVVGVPVCGVYVAVPVRRASPFARGLAVDDLAAALSC